ncbi:MAG: nucleoside triphosphate pyrophosphohydrolase [Cyanobacteriota bacterium]|nr:nucleoside triphosphate pyrophosphohydrolase [Cyanobacteriota bacterium]
MLQIVDGQANDWAEQIARKRRDAPQAALLIQNLSRPSLGSLTVPEDHPSSLSATLRQVLLDHYPAHHSVTLFASTGSILIQKGRLDTWLDGWTHPTDIDQANPTEWVQLYLPPPLQGEMQRLHEVVAHLRGPDGCPWDRAQTPDSLTPYILEEAYETVAAIRGGDPSAIAEELGDLLLQVVLQSQIFSESQTFDLETVAKGIADKLIRRHPHVFAMADSNAGDPLPMQAIHHTWDQIKQAEHPQQTLAQKLLHYAETLPPLMACLKISQKVARAGFEWPDVEGVWQKVAEEEAELRAALARDLSGLAEAERAEVRRHQLAELGDLLFTLVNLGRWYELDASQALQTTNSRFARRLGHMESTLGEAARDPDWLKHHTLAQLEALWQQAKQQYP